MKIVEGNEVRNEVMKELNFIERIIVSMFPKTFMKVYGIAGKKVVNQILE